MNPSTLFLFGNSHLGAIREGFDKIGIRPGGGPLIADTIFHEDFFTVENGTFGLRHSIASERLQTYLRRLGRGGNLLDIKLPIVCSLGFSNLRFANLFQEQKLTIYGCGDGTMVSSKCFEAIAIAEERHALRFCRMLIAHRQTVVMVPCPNRVPRDWLPLSNKYEDIMRRAFEDEGAFVIDTRTGTTDADGALLPEFELQRPGDQVHASAAYGEIIARRIVKAVEDLGAGHARTA